MILKPFILTLILLATAAGVERPNILFIAIDDLRPKLGCYGSAQVKTPHIDKLAASGMRFERAYCQVPICMGSRASLMTGMLPTSKRFVGNCRMDLDVPTAATLPEVFRKAGYTTLSNGKIYHALDDAADRSWSEAPWQPRNNMRSFDPETTRRLSKTKQRGRIYELPDVADDAYPDAVITDQFTYTSFDNGKSEMLYDLSKDPQEDKNVAGDPKHAETVASMKNCSRNVRTRPKALIHPNHEAACPPRRPARETPP